MSGGASAGGAPRRPRRAEKKAQQRQRIMESARLVFFRDGFMAANLDEVAQRAGVAKGTLYRYFDNKAELYVAILAENGDAFEHKMREAVKSDESAPDQLRTISRFYLRHWLSNREYFQIFWALENESVIGELPPSVVDQVKSLWDACLRILADVLEGGIRDGSFAQHDPWEMAHVLWTLGNGLIQAEGSEITRSLRGRDIESMFRDSVEVFLRGLRP
ncbi:MAG: TetR/AcrR family transcriptional regulator [Myxococcota bacterium]|nr:TetR/AcrR family transcriptional regulator [Myxococcota bacterium]